MGYAIYACTVVIAIGVLLYIKDKGAERNPALYATAVVWPLLLMVVIAAFAFTAVGDDK